MQFSKYHAAGNDYIAIEADALPLPRTPALMRRLMDPHYGIAADGVLIREAESDGSIGLRIVNPDGSEAEKSGNGLRIFARYLWDRGEVSGEPFDVRTPGGAVRCQVLSGGSVVRVELGRVTFDSTEIPVLGGPPREVIDETLEVGGEEVRYCAASVGNPHCVVVDREPSEAEARRLGPLLERHPSFPNRTNVQLLAVRDRGRLRIEIWERGAGYTLASGTSSSAAAAVAHRLGLCDADVEVEMPGGRLRVEIADDGSIRLTGPVAPIATGRYADAVFEDVVD